MAEFFAFLTQALAALEREHAPAYSALAHALSDLDLQLAVDGNTRALRIRAGVCMLTQDASGCRAQLVTDKATLVALLEARRTLLDVITMDELCLRGGPEHLASVHSALVAFVQGAARSISMAALLDRYLRSEAVPAHEHREGPTMTRDDDQLAEAPSSTTAAAANRSYESETWTSFEARYRDSLASRPVVVPDAAPNCVTIFGAGISGLTVAHELIERGFRVQVWDPTFDDRDPTRGCDVGGLARSQWSRVPWHEGADTSARAEISEDWRARQTQKIQHLPWIFYTSGDLDDDPIIGAVGERNAHFRPASRTHNLAEDTKKITEIVQEMAHALWSDPRALGMSVYCEVQRLKPQLKQGLERAQRVVARLNEICKGIVEISPPIAADYAYAEHLVATATWVQEPQRTIQFLITFLDDFPDGLPPGIGERISFRVRERWIPGEHGFRFFPAFYRHLFDTMSRTPILEPASKSVLAAAQERAVTVDPNPDKYIETGRSVFDNLRATTKQIISLPNSIGPTVLSRSLPKSLEELREWIRLVLEPPPELGSKTKGGFGFSIRDLALFQLKFLQYVTTCDARRAEYEHMSWLEYLGGKEAYTKPFIEILNSIPQALVAMDAQASDARTQGSVFAQLLLDNTKPDGYRDGTLVGPTSVAWLTPWRRYLEAQGVEFIHGKLVGFERKVIYDAQHKAHPITWPKVECYEPRYPGAIEGQLGLMPGYFVLALPARELCQMAREIRSNSELPIDPTGDIQRAAEYLKNDRDIQPLSTAAPTGALRHMIGIQYYFDEDVYWRDGHFYLPRSKWRVSAISQVRFWQEKHDWEHGYRGVLSVVFTTLEHRTEDGQLETLWNKAPDEIAQEIWEEICRDIGDQDLPRPRYWHIDFGFRPKWDAQQNVAGYDNATPMLINAPGRWDTRPGDLVKIKDDSLKPQGVYSKYSVEQGFVLAGTLMKTYTRLTTMEAANESGRHAANAIMQHAEGLARAGLGPLNHELHHRYTPCDIWPLELHEVDDFKLLKELDAELYRRGLDHFLEILDLPELIQTSLRGTRKHVQDMFDPLAVLSQLDRIWTSLRGDMTDVIRKHKEVL